MRREDARKMRVGSVFRTHPGHPESRLWEIEYMYKNDTLWAIAKSEERKRVFFMPDAHIHTVPEEEAILFKLKR